MKPRTVYCRYINEVGREVGLTFTYGNERVLREITNRYNLSKGNLKQYNVYEGNELIFTLEKGTITPKR